MAEIIRLHDPPRRAEPSLITRRPWEFRRAAWNTPHFVQMLRPLSEKLEATRAAAPPQSRGGVSAVPPHYVLRGGMGYTARALFVSRAEEQRMREIYHLAGLVDCIMNQVNPILRTDLLRDMYNKIQRLRQELNMHWYGPLEQVLLPIDQQFHAESGYRASLSGAATLKELYAAIREGTEEMFDILSLEYVFYCPGTGR